jgi:hypothetical protein
MGYNPLGGIAEIIDVHVDNRKRRPRFQYYPARWKRPKRANVGVISHPAMVLSAFASELDQVRLMVDGAAALLAAAQGLKPRAV